MSQGAKSQVNQNGKSDQTVEVLYQKMGDRWFAFSLINNEVFVGSIRPEELETLQARERTGNGGKPAAKTYKIAGNS